MANEQIIDYVMRFGGRCRDCADEDGTCPTNGAPCDPEQKRSVIEHTLKALEYGMSHGFIQSPFTRPTAPVEGLDTVASVNISKKLYDHLYSLAGYFIARPPTPDHEFVNVCNGDLRKLNDFINEIGTEELVPRSQAEAVIAGRDTIIEMQADSIDKLQRKVHHWQDKHETLEADNAALTVRVKGLEAERYKLVYAITGGEDAPGYLDSMSVETLVEVARDNTRRWFAETDRAEALETQLAALKDAAKSVEDWWLSEGMNHFPGAPYCIFAIRAALEDRP